MNRWVNRTTPKLQFSPPVEIFLKKFQSPVDYFEGCSAIRAAPARRRLLCLSDLQPLESPACSDWSPLIWSLADQRWGWRETLTFIEVISGPVAASGGLQGELHHLIATSVAPGPCFGSVFIIIIMNKVMFLPFFTLFVTEQSCPQSAFYFYPPAPPPPLSPTAPEQQMDAVVSDGSHRVFWTRLDVCLFWSWGNVLLEWLH